MKINQIVKGKFAGTFVILGFFEQQDGEQWAQVKEVNPANHSQVAAGELALPINLLQVPKGLTLSTLII
jgi:hypothetical protein